MQVPSPGALNVDHVAHFVPDRNACADALRRLGFAPTPFSLQQHRPRPDAPLEPVGTGNHCVMLREGYLEFLVPLADTEVAAQLRQAIARYVGAHSIVFGTSDPAADHARLVRAGFAPLPPIDLQRPIETPDGAATVRFTVVRVKPGAMAEGRIQFCRHHTESLVWQPRWLEHPNGAIALAGVYVCPEDLEEASARYARFTGLEVERIGTDERLLRTERGWVRFGTRARLEEALQVPIAGSVRIVGCELRTRDLASARRALEAGRFAWRELGEGRIAVSGPPEIGGEFVFTA